MLKIPIKYPKLSVCLLFLCAIAVVITLVLVRNEISILKREEENLLPLVEIQSNVQHVEMLLAKESPESSTEFETISDSGTIHPSELCKPVFGMLSEQCFESLGTYFLDKPFVWEGFSWLPLPLTYRRVFENPEVDRLNVIEALENPNCRLEQGEVRWDLKDVCHAESIANYSNFLYLCKDLDTQWESQLLYARTFSHGSQYEPTVKHRYENWNMEHSISSSWAGEWFLEGRWIVERVCKSFDMTELDLNEVHYEMLESIRIKLGDERGFYSRSYGVMKSLAARLGNKWASIVYESASTSEEWRIHESNEMPWKSLLKEAWSTLNSASVTSREDVRTTALRYGIQVWNELERAGLTIDLEKLVEYVCGPNWHFSTENCQDSISVLQLSDASIDQGFWHALSKFEARAIQLDLYDFEFKSPSRTWEMDTLRAADPDATTRKLSELANSMDEL